MTGLQENSVASPDQNYNTPKFFKEEKTALCVALARAGCRKF
ncbi:hypothetical protein EC915_10563 [Pseudomonas sp. LP_7_YM]|nr:hypothetical protein EC915_10563 [Pseudomonas sp. LP_7_YM]